MKTQNVYVLNIDSISCFLQLMLMKNLSSMRYAQSRKAGWFRSTKRKQMDTYTKQTEDWIRTTNRVKRKEKYKKNGNENQLKKAEVLSFKIHVLYNSNSTSRNVEDVVFVRICFNFPTLSKTSIQLISIWFDSIWDPFACFNLSKYNTIPDVKQFS